MTQAASKVFHRTLKHEPVFIERAQGNYIYEKGGRKLLDACGGAAVTSIGHGNQQVIQAVTEQLQTVPYVHSGNFATQGAEDLAEKLCESSGMARAVFMTGGSEAVESAIKVRCLVTQLTVSWHVSTTSRTGSQSASTLLRVTSLIMATHLEVCLT